MKKVLAVLLALAMVLSFAACGQKEEPVADTPEEVKKENIEISWGSSSTGGGFYYATGVIAPILTDKYDYMNVTNIATGASADNVKRILLGEIDFGMAHLSDVAVALNGDSETYKGLDTSKLNLVTYYMPGQIMFTTLKGSGITKMSDLEGKVVACGQPGSGAQANADRVLDALGINCTREYMQFSDAGIGILDGHVDVISTTGIPTAAITELSNTNEIYVIPFSDEEMDLLLDTYSFYYEDQVPIGAYRGIMEPVTCPHVGMAIICRADLPDYVVTDVLSTIYDPDTYNELGEGYGQWKFTKPGVDVLEATGFTIHPAAAKYFAENPDGYDWSSYGNNGYTNYND